MKFSLLELLILVLGASLAAVALTCDYVQEVPYELQVPQTKSVVQRVFNETTGEWIQRIIPVTEYEVVKRHHSVRKAGWPLAYNETFANGPFALENVAWRKLIADLAIPLFVTAIAILVLRRLRDHRKRDSPPIESAG